MRLDQGASPLAIGSESHLESEAAGLAFSARPGFMIPRSSSRSFKYSAETFFLPMGMLACTSTEHSSTLHGWRKSHVS